MSRTIEKKPINVEFIDKMGGDKRIVNCAKVSFSKWDDEDLGVSAADEGLLAYLATGLPKQERDDWEKMAKAHTHFSPFCHCFLSVRVEAPFFLARQLVKHQVGLAWNECYSADTEVLTSSGWKYWPEVTENDLLAVPSLCGSSYSFEKPKELVSNYYSGKLINVYSRDIDMLTTPGHDQFVSYYTSKGWTPYSKSTTAECMQTKKKFPKTMPMPELKLEEGDDYNEGMLYGAFLGDGSLSEDGLRIYFHIKKDRKKNFLRQLMENLPEFKWTETKQPNGYSYFRIYNTKGWTGTVNTKKIDFYKQTKSFYKGVLEGLISTDGCRQKNGGVSYSTVSEQLHASLAELAYTLGFDVSTHVSDREGWSRTYKMLFKKKSSKLLKNFKEVEYDGLVYCARTTTGLLIVRRNGKSCVSGNCSRRYIKDDVALWLPDVVHKAPDHAKQGASAEAHTKRIHMGFDDDGDDVLYSSSEMIEEVTKLSVCNYYDLLEAGVAPEEARIVLPLNAMTQWVWSGSLLSFNRIYQLRKDSHAQGAAQEFAHKLGSILYEHFPVSMKALNYGEEI